MINSKQLLDDFLHQLDSQFQDGEGRSMAYLAIENIFGLSRHEIMANTTVSVTSTQIDRLQQAAQRLNKNEPIQYILGEAYFYGRKFMVDSSVLIPRPETEELVSIIIERAKIRDVKNLKILDVGTGSGCIAITLALEISKARVEAIDKSFEALQVAKNNAASLGASVNFLQLDFLNEPALSEMDILVSNPPYISNSEKPNLSPNVTNFEPHLALFVDDADPLIFYRKLAQSGERCLAAGGFVAAEINERFGKETLDVFVNADYKRAELLRDLSGKERFVLAWK